MAPPFSSSSSMSGKVVLVTGANSGLGLETVRGVLRRGATVVLACRDLDKAENAINVLAEGNEDWRSRMTGMALDLSSLSSVRAFADDFLFRFDRLHCLVCNAGVMFPMAEHRKTRDGFEANVGVNHLGHFLLVNLLLDRIKESAPSRIVVVSSILLKEGEVHLENLNCELGIRATSSSTPVGYADSKLMNALFAMELRERIQSGGVDVYCVSPGWCRTSLHRNTTNFSCLKWPLLLLAAAVFMKSASKGSETIVHCACSSKAAPSSFFYRNKRPMEEMETWLAAKKVLAGQLWTKSCELVGCENQS